MNAFQQVVRRSLWVGVSGAAMLVAGCAGMSPGRTVALSGNQIVPPVTTNATGTAEITIRGSKCPTAASGLPCPQVFGTVTTAGIAATAVHIHQAAAGANGPVIVPLTKAGDNVWMVAPNTFISDAQFYDYGQGLLYVNVHSDANKGGEIRGQLKP